MLGFDVGTVITATSAKTVVKASKLCNPYIDFKLIEVKCGNADSFSTAQTPPEDVHHPETTIALVQVGNNFGIDDSITPLFSSTNPCNAHSVSIPMDSVIFYPLSSQTLYSVKFKLLSLSSQIVKVDTSLPVVFHIILRKADHNFM
jgi:hypothetical protein